MAANSHASILETFKRLPADDPTLALAGVSFGSWLYIGFGDVRAKTTRQGAVVNEAAFEVVFGADWWEVWHGDEVLLDASFKDKYTARQTVKKHLVGQDLNAISQDGEWSIFRIGPYAIRSSTVANDGEEMAGGFLYLLRSKAMGRVELQSADAARICTSG